MVDNAENFNIKDYLMFEPTPDNLDKNQKIFLIPNITNVILLFIELCQMKDIISLILVLMFFGRLYSVIVYKSKIKKINIIQEFSLLILNLFVTVILNGIW